VPAEAVRSVAYKIKPFLKLSTIVVSTSKGLEEGSGKRMDEVLAEEFSKKQPIVYLGGPMLSEEIKNKLGGRGIATSTSVNAFKQLRQIFVGTGIEIEYSNKVSAVVMVGVLKNVYALGFGICRALNLGDNFYGWYVQQAIKEMAIILNLTTGKKEIVYGLAGMGDFVSTAYSKYSRNSSCGLEIIKTGKCSLKGEGYISLPEVFKVTRKDVKKLPILNKIYSVVIKQNEKVNSFKTLLVIK